MAVDIGGTFTDVCVFDEDAGTTRVAKVPSSVDPIDAVLAGVEQAGVSVDQISLFAHGTTVATNALITRRFRPSAMVTTRGFRDIIEIRRGTKDDLWDAYHDVAPPYISRRHRLEIAERVDFEGNVVESLDETEARAIADVLRRREIESVAVCFVNSYANPVNEARMKEILEEELPGVAVCSSSEVLPEIFEHERFSTTVANAVVGPLVSRYVTRLDTELQSRGYGGDLLILHSGGGVVTTRGVERLPIRLAASGLAAGAVACRHIASLAGFENAIGLDMGGTSTDISLVHSGGLRMTNEWSVEYGYPICLPSVEVLTIGAGGGSLAYIDEAGSLRNGPQSAGAHPGPACYQLGGELPTNTDANVALGRLGSSLLGGAMTLDRDLASTAIAEHVADPLGVEVGEAALSIIDVANANMADAVRLVSIRRGYDPRDFALVVFGGAGPLHGAALADELSIPTVLVPPNPGISSALGCLLVDIRHDLSAMLLDRADWADVAELERRFVDLEVVARDRLSHEGVDPAAMRLERSIDMRYRGQWRSLNVSVPSPLTSVDDAVGRFHAEHEREYSFRKDSAPVELYRLNVTAVGTTPKPELRRHESISCDAKPTHGREVLFREGLLEVGVYERSELGAGSRVHGPAVIDQFDSTTLVPPGWVATVDEWMNIRLDKVGAAT